MTRGRFLAALAAAWLLAGCARERGPAEEAATVQDGPAAEVTQEVGGPGLAPPAGDAITFAGYGQVRFGVPVDELRQALAGGFDDARPEEPGGCHYLLQRPVAEAGYRVAFMIEGGRFVRVDVGDPGVAAPGGGRVGMDIADIRRLYGARAEAFPHKYDPQGLVLRVVDPDGGEGVLVFEAGADERVMAWRAGVPPQVDYVEGCG